MKHSPTTVLLALSMAVSACATTGLPEFNSEGIAENRQHKVDSIVPPLGATCRLHVTRKKALLFSPDYFSSGAHIGGGVILTAAHNLHSATFSKVKSASVECGITEHKADTDDPNSLARSQIAVTPGYTWKDYARDTAIIRIPNHPTAHFEVATDDLQLQEGEDVHLSGFPGDGYTDHGELLFSTVGKIVKVTPEFVIYAITTATGNSGGPVWIEKNGSFIVVGVHVSGSGNVGTARRVSQSSIKSLTNSLSVNR